METDRTRRNILYRIAEFVLPFVLLFILNSITAIRIPENIILFSIFIRHFFAAPQVLARTTSRSISGIYENLLCTPLDIRKIVCADATVAFVKDFFASSCYVLVTWTACMVFSDISVLNMQTFYFFLFTMLLNPLLLYVVSALAVYGGIRKETFSSYLVMGILVSVILLMFENVWLQAAIASGITLALVICLARTLRKTANETILK